MQAPSENATPASRPRSEVRMRIGLETRAETDPDYARYLAIEAAHDRIDPPLPAAPRR